MIIWVGFVNCITIPYLDNRQTVITIRNTKPLPQPNQMPVRNKIPATNRMKRAEHQLRLHIVTNQPGQPLAHLATRLDGERAADDVLRPETMVCQQVRDACGQGLGLAGAGRCEDLEDGRGRRHRSPLGLIEAIEDQVHCGQWLVSWVWR